MWYNKSSFILIINHIILYYMQIIACFNQQDEEKGPYLFMFGSMQCITASDHDNSVIGVCFPNREFKASTLA